jgi:hypothetical protein
MKTLLIFSILCAFFASSLAGQIQIDALKTKKNNKIYLEKHCSIVTNDGGILALGNTSTLLKLNKALGIKLGEKINTDENELLSFIKQTDDGGYFLLSSSYSSPQKTDKAQYLIISRLDRHFGIIWRKKTKINTTFTTIRCVAVTKNGNYVIAGNRIDKKLVISSYAAAFDATGDLKWEYNPTPKNTDESFDDMIVDKNNNIVLITSYNRTDSSNQVFNNGALLKLNPDGKKIWEWHHPLNTKVRMVDVCENKKYGGYLITGSIESKKYGLLAHFIYISPLGEVVWTKNMGSQYDDEAVQSISTHSDIYLTVGRKSKKEEYLYTPDEYLGETDIWLIALDYSGNLLWEKTYGTSNDDYALSIYELSDNSYLLSGKLQYLHGDAPKTVNEDDYRVSETVGFLMRFRETMDEASRRKQQERDSLIQIQLKKILPNYAPKKFNIDSISIEYLEQMQDLIDWEELDWEKEKTNYEIYKMIPRVWAVVVGVSDYSEAQNAEGLADLRYAHSDAQRIYDFLRSPEGGAVPAAQISLLTNENATADNVLAAANKLFSQAAPKDLVLFYFSGHGEMNTFLAYNSDLMHSDLEKAFINSPATQRLCIADACHSGSWEGRKRYVKNTADDEELRRMYYENLRLQSNLIALFMGTGYKQFAYEESNNANQGVFTHFYLKGLGGEADANKDRIITVQEIYEYVKQNVFEKTKSLNPPQVPQIQGFYDNSMPLSVVRKK